ncbi:MAG TPA: glutathione S-transferase C-terminal domain-containing protein [Solirubrobacteraceae bacterium]|nr:glutathione S-transferase C-terminal domain-containing protein [Solirubrobacteraceae bacterium]
MSADAFSIDRETSEEGAFRRQDSRFRDTDVEPVAGRYHLYVSWACPWACRTVIARMLTGTQEALPMSIVAPLRDARGWRFTGGEYVDQAEGAEFLSELYARTDPGFDGRVSVPVLWDTAERRIVNNESADILRMFSTGGLAELATRRAGLYPEALRDEIDELNERIYDDVNNAVYKAGFTTSQAIYDAEVAGLFAMLDELDERLAERRYLFGDQPVETDWRLFTTLVRFDPVYAIHFKCSRRRIVDYPSLWPYLRDLYQRPGIAATVRMDDIRQHYYRTHPAINPSGIVAVAPDIDLRAPHGRERLGS